MRNSKWKKENKSIHSNSKVYKKALVAAGIKDGSVENYRKRLTRHVHFIRHSDLSDGESCTDEVIRK